MANTKPVLFISYRRTNLLVIDHLYDKCESEFGAANIFLDRADIKPGERFPDRIKSAVLDASIVLVIIGKDWISVQDERTYRRRIEMPDDWVRQELEIALGSEKTVIPVLIEGAAVVTTEQLPESLQTLATRNAIVLSREHFREDANRLIAHIKAKLNAEQMTRLMGSKSRFPNAGKIKPAPLSDAELAAMSAELPQWKVVQTLIADDPRYDPGYQGSEIVRDFKFATFVDAIDFMRQAAAQINVLDHHPRWENVFRTVTVHYTTFDIGHRVSDRDYKNAAMLERLYLEFIAVKRAG